MKTSFLVIATLVGSLAHAQPWTPIVIWERDGLGDSSLYGTSILALGDQNSDGFKDWAVYAQGQGNAPSGDPNEPRVEFFYGGNPPDTVPYMTRVADHSTEIAIRGARALGDLNGDGYVDWYIFTSFVGDPAEHRIFKIYFGGPGSHEQPDLIFVAPWFSGYRCVGDFNGDGYDDLQFTEGMDDRADILYGGNPMDTIPDWSHRPTLISMGYGDVNDDNYSDFVSDLESGVGPQIYLGGSAPANEPAYTWTPLHSVATTIISDVNGDRYAELCFGQPGGMRLCLGGDVLDSARAVFLDFPCAGSAPMKICSAGDLNHDGYQDVAMFSFNCNGAGSSLLSVHLGHPWMSAEPAFTIGSGSAPTNLPGIRSAASLGDVDGDGVDDLGIGGVDPLPQAGWRGRAVIISGDTTLIVSADAPPAIPEAFDVSVYPNPFNSSTMIQLKGWRGSGQVTLSIANLLGQEVRREILLPLAGEYTYHLDAREWSTGIYFVLAEAGEWRAIRKVTLLR